MSITAAGLKRSRRSAHRTGSDGLRRRCSELSIVCPDIDVTMSPGLTAVPDGMFSHAATTPITLSLSFSLRHRAQGADHAGSAAHVEFHFVHRQRRA